MALDLSAIAFRVDTTELDRAGKAIGDLVVNVGKLEKATTDAAKTEATLAKTAKDNAKANLDNAKAAEVVEKAQKKVTEAVEKNTSVLQRQKDILDFQTQGYSKGQSSILAYGKSAGLAADEISELGKVLETQRKLMGGDPFDKSLSGIKALKNQYTELKESVRQYATDSNLTAKQTRELARDKERLIEKMKVEAASFSEIRKAVRAHNEEYIKLAASYNRVVSAEDSVIKSRKDAVTATNYLTQADQKMAAALNVSNVALDKAGTDSLVKYESALRKSGLAQESVTQKLATYKTQLAQVQAQEQKRTEQNLTRASMPQITDLAVSIYSGQSPLTVLLQQGGQLSDLLVLSGVEAEKFGDILRNSFYSMLPAIKQVTLGIAGLVGGLFLDAGSAITSFISNTTGITAAMESVKRSIVSGGEANFKYIASIEKIGKAASISAASGIAALIAGVILLGLEYKKIIQLEAQLSAALALSGGALGITKDQAVAAAEAMSSFGVGSLKAIAAITEIAKAGNIGKESLELVTKAAIDLEKTAGVSIEETAKQYSKLQEDPAKALTDIAQKTGLVDKATLDYVYSLEQQGEKTEAARVATIALASAHAQTSSEIRDNWSPIEVLWNDIKSAISAIKQEIYSLTTSNEVVGIMRTLWETVAVTVSEVWFTIKGVGKEIGGVGAQIAAVLRGDFDAAAEIGKQMKLDAAAAAQEQKDYVKALLDRTKTEQKSFNQSKEQNSEYAKWRKENSRALEENITKEDKYKAKQLELQKAVLAGTVSQIEADKALAGWKKIILGKEKEASKKDPSENYYATLMREATAATIKADDATKSLTDSQIKMLERVQDPRFLKMSKAQQENYLSTMAANVGKEQQIALTEAQAAAEERLLRLLGKSSGIGRQYYSDMANMEKDAALLGKSREEIEELTRAIFMATPAWKEYQKALDAVNTAASKFNEDSIASQSSVLQENLALDFRLSLLGKTTEEQKAMSIEYNKANKLREVDIKLAKQLREIEEKIAKAKKDGLPQSEYQALVDAEVQARKDAAEQAKAINREVAVQYAEDLQREIDSIRSGITDSIVTALFEGGKEGGKKLRSVLVSILRQKVTLVVDAVVNTLLGNVIGSFLGGGGGIGGAVGGGAGGLINAGMQGYSLYSGLTSGTGILGRIGGMIGLGASAGTTTTIGVGTSLANPGMAAAINPLAGAGAGAGGGLGALATAAPYILAIVAIAASWKKLFGRELKDSGIQGQFGGKDGFEGQAYRFYKGGLFRSDKTELSPIDKALQKQLGDAFTVMKTQVTDFAKVLGLNADKLKNFTSDIKISLHGMNENDISAKIQEALATVNNEMAQEILGEWEDKTRTERRVVAGTGSGSSGRGADDLDSNPAQFEDVAVTERIYKASKYAKEGEKAIDTLTRLATSLSTVNQVFDTLGYKMYEASLAGGDMASKLADLFGGLDKLVASTTFYYQNFYSEAERQATAQRQLEKEFKKNNLTMPKTREEYRKLVEAQDLSTEEGRKMYALLLQLAPAFAEITQTAEEIAAAAKDKLRNALEDAYSNLEKAVNAQKELLQQQAQAAQETVNRLKGIFDLLARNVKELYMQVDSTAKMLANRGRDVIRNALSSGVLPDQSVLEDAISAVRADLDNTEFATQFEQDKARLQLAAELQILQDQAGSQLSVAELTLKAIKDQIEYLDGLLKTAREQIDAALGITNAVLSVEQALLALAEALKPPDKGTIGKGDNSAKPSAVWGASGSGSGGGNAVQAKYRQVTSLGTAGVGYVDITDDKYISKLDSLAGIYHSFDGTGNLTGLLDAIRAAGGSLADLSALSGYFANDWRAAAEAVGVQPFANGGAFTNGVVSKPTSFNMGLMGEAGSEAIMPLTNIGGRLGVSAVSSDNSELADKVGRLESALQVIAVNTSKVARILDAAQGTDGRSIITTPAV